MTNKVFSDIELAKQIYKQGGNITSFLRGRFNEKNNTQT